MRNRFRCPRAATVLAAALCVVSVFFARGAATAASAGGLSAAVGAPSADRLQTSTTSLPLGPNDDASIEWWYFNAHITTQSRHHLAVVGSFFRFGNGHALLNPAASQPRGHYLIYAVTDLDNHVQRPYSLTDAGMVAMLRQVAPYLGALNPDDRQVKALVDALNAGSLPSPHQQMETPAQITASPFRIAYDQDDTFGVSGTGAAKFDLHLNGQPDQITLHFSSEKPVMPVGGNGDTGLTKPTDMRYFSLTRCAVTGSIDTGSGEEPIQNGQGWIDHQWGGAWLVQNNGWDWWGVQLTDGSDILFFRQRSLATGSSFTPLATFSDKNGRLTVTRNVQFEPDPKSLWKSPTTGIRYPLAWTVTFPDQHIRLRIAASVNDQEMPILGPGGAIWEGSCGVSGLQHARWKDLNPEVREELALSFSPDPVKRAKLIAAASKNDTIVSRGINGVAYMELVGYGSPAVEADPIRAH